MQLDIHDLSTYSYSELEMALHIAGSGLNRLIPHNSAQLRAEIERRSTPVQHSEDSAPDSTHSPDQTNP